MIFLPNYIRFVCDFERCWFSWYKLLLLQYFFWTFTLNIPIKFLTNQQHIYIICFIKCLILWVFNTIRCRFIRYQVYCQSFNLFSRFLYNLKWLFDSWNFFQVEFYIVEQSWNILLSIFSKLYKLIYQNSYQIKKMHKNLR